MSEAGFQTLEKLHTNMQCAILGKPEVVQSLLIALIAGEHILLDDVPGVGRTLMARTLARSLASEFHRIQFTPDLLPSDIVGSNLYRSDLHHFEFNPGPIFANIVLADEINRAPPRTQSALLEAMSERQVTVDGVTNPLPDPFFVVATQNPFEHEGTYRLPESQLDRFLLRTTIGYPSLEVERDILKGHRECDPIDQLSPVATCDEIVACKRMVRHVRVDDSILDYLLAIVEATRTSKDLDVGVSTRAALSFYRGCQARAMILHRDFVVPDDIKALAIPCFSHRIVARGAYLPADYSSAEQIVQEILDCIPVPI